MEQHPVPQPITTYQFRLVGDMTLRQFGQLAGGVLIAFLIYSLPIPIFLKWPGIIFFGFLGFAFAFVPLEERPLDKWFVAFLKSIFSPTLYTWQQSKKVPEFFLQMAPPQLEPAFSEPPKASSGRLDDYLKSLGRKKRQTKDEEKEELELERVEALFTTAHLPTGLKVDAKQRAVDLEDSKPQLKLRPRKLTVPPAPTVIMRTAPLNMPEQKPKPFLSPKPKPAAEVKKISPIPADMPPKIVIPKTVVEATASEDLPIPAAPTQPNVVVGMILDTTGKIVDNAIIEIRDKNGLPVRALKSNQLGQFRIVTPLPKGVYEMEVEKDGLQFDIININISGEVVRPIEIRAKNQP